MKNKYPIEFEETLVFATCEIAMQTNALANEQARANELKKKEIQLKILQTLNVKFDKVSFLKDIEEI